MKLLFLSLRKGVDSYIGLLAVLCAICIIAILSKTSFHGIAPDIICFTALIYAAYRGGRRQGVIAALCSFFYFAVAYSAPSALFHYSSSSIPHIRLQHSDLVMIMTSVRTFARSIDLSELFKPIAAVYKAGLLQKNTPTRKKPGPKPKARGIESTTMIGAHNDQKNRD